MVRVLPRKGQMMGSNSFKLKDKKKLGYSARGKPPVSFNIIMEKLKISSCIMKDRISDHSIHI